MSAREPNPAPKAAALVIGGGPAGLMAAETLARAGVGVRLREQAPTLGRKFLMAGRGGLNLTHSEPSPAFLERYGAAAGRLGPLIDAFTPQDLRRWAEDLGQATFVGTSGRVFPRAMKASPLLRAWTARLAGLGVELRVRSRWTGWSEDGGWTFAEADGSTAVERPGAVVLALGGASWPRLGSDGAWAARLAGRGADLAPFRPSNMGFRVDWSPLFRERFAGAPLKGVALAFGGRRVMGDLTLTDTGVEGGALYALSAALRDAVEADGPATLTIDLRPGLDREALRARLARTPEGQSLSNRLRKGANLAPVEANLLREVLGPAPPFDPDRLAGTIKALPLRLVAPGGIERAISTAGGLRMEALTQDLMIRAMPGVWAAGEMLDWEAPTGGYLLQACFATGRAAGLGAAAWLGR